MDTGLLRQLNNDIWHPFGEAYAALDVPAFLGLHSPDLIRAGGPGKQASGFAAYAAQIEEWFTELARRGSSVAITFRFVERLAANDVACERGVFEIVARRADGDQRVFHGRFHTFSRRLDGRWRIVADYDNDERPHTLAADFAAAAEVDDVGAFSGPAAATA